MYTDDDLVKMTLERALSEISNAVYKASALFEDLEHERKIYGNGHCIRQKICEFAMKLMKERWLDK